jgi:hypothetical protein
MAACFAVKLFTLCLCTLCKKKKKERLLPPNGGSFVTIIPHCRRRSLSVDPLLTKKSKSLPGENAPHKLLVYYTPQTSGSSANYSSEYA